MDAIEQKNEMRNNTAAGKYGHIYELLASHDRICRISVCTLYVP